MSAIRLFRLARSCSMASLMNAFLPGNLSRAASKLPLANSSNAGHRLPFPGDVLCHHLVDPARHGPVRAFEPIGRNRDVDVAFVVLLRHPAHLRDQRAELVNAIVQVILNDAELSAVILGNFGRDDALANGVNVLRGHVQRPHQAVDHPVDGNQRFALARLGHIEVGALAQPALLNRARETLKLGERRSAVIVGSGCSGVSGRPSGSGFLGFVPDRHVLGCSVTAKF